MRYRSTFNAPRLPGEVLKDKDKTQPGQSYTVREALERVQFGLPVSTGRRFAYAEEGDESVPFFRRDLTDLDEAKNQLTQIRQQYDEFKKKREAGKKPPGSHESEKST